MGDHFGITLGYIWCHCGITLVWGHLGITLGWLGDHVGITLRSSPRGPQNMKIEPKRALNPKIQAKTHQNAKIEPKRTRKNIQTLCSKFPHVSEHRNGRETRDSFAKKSNTSHRPLHAQHMPARRDSYKPYVQNFEKTSMVMQGANVFVDNLVFQTRVSTY